MGRLIAAYWLEEKLKKALKSIEDTLFEAVLNGDEELSKAGQNQHSAYSTALTLLKHAPTVDAVPVVHGEWLYIEGSWECSVCRKENACAYDEVLHRFIDFFCPKCGAKIDGKEKE